MTNNIDYGMRMLSSVHISISLALMVCGHGIAAVTYVNDNFEGESTGTFATTANSTGFISTANNTANVTIQNTIASTAVPIDTSQDPSGKNLRVTGNRDKHITMTNAMSLATDGVQTVDVTFKLYFNTVSGQNFNRLIYSAAGDFSDSTVVQAMSTNATPDTANYVFGADQWYAVTIQFDASDVTGGFTDTAKIRFAQDSGGATSTHFHLDDVLITGIIPEPSSMLLGSLGSLLLLRRQRRD